MSHTIESRFAPGEAVILVDPDIPARVASVLWTTLGVQYVVSYWTGDQISGGTFDACELVANTGEPRVMGFGKGSHDEEA